MLSVEQEWTLLVVTWTASALSILGSSLLIYVVWVRHVNHQLRDIYHRLLLGLSVYDWLHSLGWVLSPLLLPATINNNDKTNRLLAMGTTETCTVGGFLINLASSSYLYNAGLSIYFLVVIRYGLTEQRISEWTLHTVPTLVGIGTGIVCIGLKLFNPVAVGSFCWIAELPDGCNENDRIECQRGHNATLYGYVFAGIPGMAVPTVLVCNLLIYSHVRKLHAFDNQLLQRQRQQQQQQQRRRRRPYNSDYQTKSQQQQQQLPTTQVAVQASLYVVAFLNSFVWALVLRVLDANEVVTRHNEQDYFVLLLLERFFFPLQGFFNSLVYFRPRYLRLRRYKGNGRWQALYKTVVMSTSTSTPAAPSKRKDNNQRHCRSPQPEQASPFHVGLSRYAPTTTVDPCGHHDEEDGNGHETPISTNMEVLAVAPGTVPFSAQNRRPHKDQTVRYAVLLENWDEDSDCFGASPPPQPQHCDANHNHNHGTTRMHYTPSSLYENDDADASTQHDESIGLNIDFSGNVAEITAIRPV